MEKNDVCYLKIDLKNSIPNELLNSSARKLNNKHKVKFLSKYIMTQKNLSNI